MARGVVCSVVYGRNASGVPTGFKRSVWLSVQTSLSQGGWRKGEKAEERES